eukprot:GHVQ01006237.1.p1 GENE.GHVQ01006237.1~~GHVQ01006237.1.p1  ORF type:complete len:721 (-),score=100.59 GHVQ01006237.1:199-2361(-)
MAEAEEEVSSHMYSQLRKLINIVDELRDVGLQRYINLPRICVVGTQSSGKSSVLESVMGLDFLPRGEGVVTRRPIELRLIHLSEAEHSLDESWVEFEGAKDEKVENFAEARKRIERLTDEVAGTNKGIIDEPMVLSVYATQCPDLTLIDLPGITRVPIKGSDQTDDIERLTRDMASRYAEDPRTIILAVLPANADMSTSDALQLARRVDPDGTRTIGVITKLDLMDRGMDATRMLLGEEVPLRLGYTGLINRSQADIREGKSIKQAIEDEKQFFLNHPAYRSLAPGLLGVRCLIDKLTTVLFGHIRAFLPEIKREINNKLRSVEGRISELGEGVPEQPSQMALLLWRLIKDYCDMFKNTIRGKYDKRLESYFEDEDITEGGHIQTIFSEVLEEYVDKDITHELTDYDIDLAIRMSEGDSPPGCLSPGTFEFLMQPHLQKIHAPAMDTLDRTAQTLELLSQKIAHRVFGRFPHLQAQILEVSQDILQTEKRKAKAILEHMIQLEIGYLFTNDADCAKYSDRNRFVKTENRDAQQPQAGAGAGGGGGGGFQQNTRELYNHARQSMSGVWNEKKKTTYSECYLKEIRNHVDTYFGIVLKNVRDTIPRTIGYFLVRQLEEKLEIKLYGEFTNEQKYEDLLGEPAHIMEERKALRQQQATMMRAMQVLQRDPRIASLSLHTSSTGSDTSPLTTTTNGHSGGSYKHVGGGGRGGSLSPHVNTPLFP